MKGEDIEGIRSETDRLMQSAARLAEAMQRADAEAAATGAGAGATAAGAQTSGGPDVVDAEFEEVDDQGRKAG
jgi:molecular chaperone DnaK